MENMLDNDVPQVTDSETHAALPTVSIVVPSYNQGKFIQETIDSILNQNYRPIEIYVVDGASTDETLDVLNSYEHVPELTWISEPDKGVVDAVNKGFLQVQGDIVGIQSSDDVYLPGAITQIVQAFLQDKALGLVYGDTIKVDADGKELLKQSVAPYTLENFLLGRTWIPQPSAFFRRDLLDICGGWDDRVSYAADTDLWLRMAFKTKVKKLNAYLSQRRIHDAQRDTQSDRIARDYARMIDQSPDIAQASAQIRRAAKAGKCLKRIRYNDSGSDWVAAWNQLMAGLIYPQIRNLPKVGYLLLLPVLRQLSFLKQRVFRLPGRVGLSSSGS